MRVGDIVFALRNQRMCPGKLQLVNHHTAVVKFYQLKTPQEVHLKDIQPYTSESAKKFSQKRGWKKMSMAIKQAQKDYKCSLVNMTPHSIKDGNMTSINHNDSKQHEVKEQEYDCKEEQEDEQKEKVSVLYYQTLVDFLMTQNELAILEDCRQNKPKEYSYMCSASKSVITVVKLPKYCLVNLLNELLHLTYDGKCNKQKAVYQKKVMNILKSNLVSLQDCLNSKVMKWVSMNISYYDQMGSQRQASKQYLSALHQFASKHRRDLQNHLDEYTEIIEFAENLSLLASSGLQQ